MSRPLVSLIGATVYLSCSGRAGVVLRKRGAHAVDVRTTSDGCTVDFVTQKRERYTVQCCQTWPLNLISLTAPVVAVASAEGSP